MRWGRKKGLPFLVVILSFAPAHGSDSFQPLANTLLGHMIENPAALRVDASLLHMASHDKEPCTQLRLRIHSASVDRTLLTDPRFQLHLKALLFPHVGREAELRAWEPACPLPYERVKIDILDSDPEGPSPPVDPETFDSMATLESVLEIAVSGSAEVTLDACRQLRARVFSEFPATEAFQEAVRYFFFRAARRAVLRLVELKECETYPTILMEFLE